MLNLAMVTRDSVIGTWILTPRNKRELQQAVNKYNKVPRLYLTPRAQTHSHSSYYNIDPKLQHTT